MIVTLTKDYDGRRAGESFDLPDTAAQTLVQAGLATQATTPPTPNLDAAAQALESRISEMVQASIVKAVSHIRPAQGVYQISPGESEADRRKSFADNIRCIVAAQRYRDPEAFERLAKVYGARRYGPDGEIEPVRSLADASIKASSGATGAAGGFLIAPEYVQDLFRLSAETAVFAPFTRQVNMVSREQFRPALAQTGAPVSEDSSPMYAGIRIYYKSETAKRTASQPVYEQIDLVAHDATGYTEASRDLLADAPGHESEIQAMFREAIAYNVDYVSMFGDGINKALGALHSGNPCRLVVNRADNNKFTYADALAMYSRLHMPSAPGAYWLMSQTVIPQLGTLSVGSTPIWIANTGGAQGGLPSTLLGLPIRFTEKLPALGTTGDVCLVNPRFYYLGFMQSLEVGVSEDFKFDEDLIAFRFKLRWGGKPALRATVKLHEGRTTGNTEVSPFIVLGPKV